MTATRDVSQLRRYVLGGSTEEEAAATEGEYFEDGDALDRVRAAENDLIDEYVSGELAADERDEFERHYLTTPGHRRRVAVARALRAAEPAMSGQRRRFAGLSRPAASLAAALVLLIVGGLWFLRPGSETEMVGGQRPRPPVTPVPEPPRADSAPAPQPAPVGVVLSISPILVRGVDQPASLAIPAGTDIVTLRLQGQPVDRQGRRGRAIVRTVVGREIWQGPTTIGSQRQELARVDIPAARLGPDDYIVELVGIEATGREVELYRYYFRVRAP
ncbi:MAG TPA: zf-HC2 domain-containing protein [Vicinamibacterales bacterium]|jgi:hypothetical protein|nr:zf-HC2 domain-containing protein [Vicinamibacterales bacterium]